MTRGYGQDAQTSQVGIQLPSRPSNGGLTDAAEQTMRGDCRRAIRVRDPARCPAHIFHRVRSRLVAERKIGWPQGNAIAGRFNSRSTRISLVSSYATARSVAGPRGATGSRWFSYRTTSSGGAGARNSSPRGRSRAHNGKPGSAVSAALPCQARTTRRECSYRQVPLPRAVTRSGSSTTSGWARRPPGTKSATRGSSTPRDFVADIGETPRSHAHVQHASISGLGGKVDRCVQLGRRPYAFERDQFPLGPAAVGEPKTARSGIRSRRNVPVPPHPAAHQSRRKPSFDTRLIRSSRRVRHAVTAAVSRPT